MCLLSCCTFLCTLFFRKVRLRSVVVFCLRRCVSSRDFLKAFCIHFCMACFLRNRPGGCRLPYTPMWYNAPCVVEEKSRILCFRSVCSKSKNRGIHRGIRGGSGGDPGPKRGIRVIHVISKPMKTGGSTACSSPLYNINKRQRGVTEARKAFRFLEFYLPSGSVHGLWSRLGFLGRWFWPPTSSK